jgi:ribosomal protein L37AE/L43A
VEITNEMIELIKSLPEGVRFGPCTMCGKKDFTARVVAGAWGCLQCLEKPNQKLLAIESRIMSKGWAS